MHTIMTRVGTFLENKVLKDQISLVLDQLMTAFMPTYHFITAYIHVLKAFLIMNKTFEGI